MTTVEVSRCSVQSAILVGPHVEVLCPLQPRHFTVVGHRGLIPINDGQHYFVNFGRESFLSIVWQFLVKPFGVDFLRVSISFHFLSRSRPAIVGMDGSRASRRLTAALSDRHVLFSFVTCARLSLRYHHDVKCRHIHVYIVYIESKSRK